MIILMAVSEQKQNGVIHLLEQQIEGLIERLVARNLPKFLAQLSECLDGPESDFFALNARLDNYSSPTILVPRAFDSCRLVDLFPSMVDPGVLGFGFDGGKVAEIIVLGKRRKFQETDDLAAWEELTKTRSSV